ncbi:hypothetical protein [Nocardioides speluncae]|uniref:hypothetical protein n=1 Tax=Nocardioides speluncae TaxID=2670337 RepID=UPI0012B182AE|nr:hypothetical protein [Nocardioides speluncae]
MRYAALPNVVIPLPDGRRIAVGSPDRRRVMIQRYSPGSQTWSKPSLLFHKKGLECGDVSGKASAGGVALLLECDPGWSEDQAPVHSHALASRDTFTWARHQVPGEAYTTPGISPDGRRAVWLGGGSGHHLTWRLGHGFQSGSVPFDSDEYGVTAVVSDPGEVTVAGAISGEGDGCSLGFVTRALDGGVRKQQLELAPGEQIGCTELGVDNVDLNTVLAGFGSRATTFRVTRPDADSPFAVTRVAPFVAPDLISYPSRPRRAMYTRFHSARGQALFAVGSPDRRRIRVQRYDEQAQRWLDPVTVYDHGFRACTWGGFGSDGDYWSVLAVDITCYPKRSADGDYPPTGQYGQPAPRGGHIILLNAGQGWRRAFLGAHPLGAGGGGALLAVPTSGRVVVASKSGVIRLPVRATRRCDIVLPIGPRTVLRVTDTGGNNGWPNALQRSTATGWKTIQRLRLTRPGPCVRAIQSEVAGPRFYLDGRSDQVAVRFVRVDGRWRARIG